MIPILKKAAIVKKEISKKFTTPRTLIIDIFDILFWKSLFFIPNFAMNSALKIVI